MCGDTSQSSYVQKGYVRPYLAAGAENRDRAGPLGPAGIIQPLQQRRGRPTVVTGPHVLRHAPVWLIGPMATAAALERRLGVLARGLGLTAISRHRAAQPAAAVSSAPLTVGFAGVHRSIPEPPASAGGGGAGGPQNPGGHNWAAGVAQLSSADVRITAVYDYDGGTRKAFAEAWVALDVKVILTPSCIFH